MLAARSQGAAGRCAHHGGMEFCRPARSRPPWAARSIASSGSNFPPWRPIPISSPKRRRRSQGAGADQNTPVLFLCRSGARSRAAAMALTAGRLHPGLQCRGRLRRRSRWRAPSRPQQWLEGRRACPGSNHERQNDEATKKRAAERQEHCGRAKARRFNNECNGYDEMGQVTGKPMRADWPSAWARCATGCGANWAIRCSKPGSGP